jgi:hypothetical protein
MHLVGFIIRIYEDARSPETQIQQTFLMGNFINRRPVGKPRTRWKNIVRRDTAQILGIEGWRRQASDTEEWRRLLRETIDRRI